MWFLTLLLDAGEISWKKGLIYLCTLAFILSLKLDLWVHAARRKDHMTHWKPWLFWKMNDNQSTYFLIIFKDRVLRGEWRMSSPWSPWSPEEGRRADCMLKSWKDATMLSLGPTSGCMCVCARAHMYLRGKNCYTSMQRGVTRLLFISLLYL